ncbi:hypothetical protein [Nitrosomonas marina]|uniref:hypothetical protein n=1 Tax=Nitrosomonas marina TaxID=917 RepID=UPI00115FF5D0|nr:hypothetical protein [Nitrosomonas marina]
MKEKLFLFFGNENLEFPRLFGLIACVAAVNLAGINISVASEPNQQTSTIRKMLADGWTPGLGTGSLDSTAVLRVCDVLKVDEDHLDEAILQGLREYYINIKEEKHFPDNKERHYKTKRFLLKRELVDSHNTTDEQVFLDPGIFHSMDLQIKARVKKVGVFLTLTTTVYNGSSNNLQKHSKFAGSYNGHFFHEYFGNFVLEKLVKNNCEA